MQVQIFKFEQKEQHLLNEIRTVEIDGKIWFVGIDVAKVLGYSNTNDANARHCKSSGIVKREVATTNKFTPMQNMSLINEPNVYRLIIKSQLESAERFEEWLFSEVLPSIRKKGFHGKIDRTALPNFIERYKDNYHKLPPDHFSVISEMYARLYLALEKVGYQIPDKGMAGKQMMPDISVGRGFATFLKDNNSKFYDECQTVEREHRPKRCQIESAIKGPFSCRIKRSTEPGNTRASVGA
ncbi:MAG: hypothetical protein J7619_09415 [Dyadobacter sp.]|uniref:BRO-N domain-containing protein n=1 Tax=Dyadobacter sp. TaxID=1914288 RepID=UPI001B2F25A3|nr:BRO family protein [Dyadobacter sp.]MBO9612901.1 hypothetical protein [Dyadobacter sp.]